MSKEILEQLEEIKKYIWLETGNANMLYGKREYINDKLKKIIYQLSPYPTHECWCGNQETCDCISEPNDNDFGPYWCEDENGNLIEMTKVEGSRVMNKEEVEELNKIKLPF